MRSQEHSEGGKSPNPHPPHSESLKNNGLRGGRGGRNSIIASSGSGALRQTPKTASEGTEAGGERNEELQKENSHVSVVKRGGVLSRRGSAFSRRGSTVSRHGSTVSGHNDATVMHLETSLIIDMRLEKEIASLRELKPSLATKKELLKNKLFDLRLAYKEGLPGYNELLSHEDVRAHKTATIKDVKMLLEGGIEDAIKKTEVRATNEVGYVLLLFAKNAHPPIIYLSRRSKRLI